MIKTAVIGAGALGTALAQSISYNIDTVYLYARRQKVVDDINTYHHNKDYYPTIKLNNNIKGFNNLEQLKEAECIILTIPSSSLREIMQNLKDIIPKTCLIISTIKGIEKTTSKTASQVIKEFTDNPQAILSGPNIAREIIQGLPAATTIAVNTKKDEETTRKILESDKFKLQFNHDAQGTELCGIIKNILAISFGICEGLKINDSAKFAILNKGFVEASQILEKLGSNPYTILDYCGFGDIVTASTLSVSRNHTLGVLYGQKIVIDEQKTGVVFEGKSSIITMKKICQEHNIQSTIIDFVNKVIIEKESPEKSFEELWENLE